MEKLTTAGTPTIKAGLRTVNKNLQTEFS